MENKDSHVHEDDPPFVVGWRGDEFQDRIRSLRTSCKDMTASDLNGLLALLEREEEQVRSQTAEYWRKYDGATEEPEQERQFRLWRLSESNLRYFRALRTEVQALALTYIGSLMRAAPPLPALPIEVDRVTTRYEDEGKFLKAPLRDGRPLWRSDAKWPPYGRFIINRFHEFDASLSQEEMAKRIQISLNEAFPELDTSTFTGKALRDILLRDARGQFKIVVPDE